MHLFHLRNRPSPHPIRSIISPPKSLDWLIIAVGLLLGLSLALAA